MTPFTKLSEIDETGFVNLKESENGCCVPLLNRSIQDLSDHMVRQKTVESTSTVDSSVHLTHHDPKDLELICSVKERKIHFRILSDSFGFKNSILDFLKETHPKLLAFVPVQSNDIQALVLSPSIEMHLRD